MMNKGTIEEAVEETYKELFVKYEKALDKACKYLETYDRKGNYLKIGYTIEEWKK